MYIFLIIHIFLFFLWKHIEIYEKKNRVGGHKIPFYFSGDIGDPISSIFIVMCFELIYSSIFFQDFMIGILIGSFTALTLTFYWSHNSKIRGHIVSLYDEKGNPTIAGNIHIGYIAYTSSIIVTSGLILVQDFLLFPFLLFFSGILIFTISISIDKFRGVI